MIDFVKAISEDQRHVKKLKNYAMTNLKRSKPQNNNYITFSDDTRRYRLEFRKVYLDGELIGFRNVEICFSPHYLFNNNLHNGNQFSPVDSAKIIQSIFLGLGISKIEMTDFRVVNLEYGLNLIVGVSVENLIDGLFYTKKTLFQTRNFPYFKISNSTKFKEIKCYAKGLQFLSFPEYNIDRDTFRFEVRTKKTDMIKTLGIFNVKDLINLDKYNALFQSILNEWQNVLIVNMEVKNKHNTLEFWKILKNHSDRNKFTKTKANYYKKLERENNLHRFIKLKIIDKITELQKGAYCPQQNPMDTEKTQ